MEKNKNKMSSNTSSIVSKVWSFCNPLRDGGVGYGDYLEQLTYLQQAETLRQSILKKAFEGKLVKMKP